MASTHPTLAFLARLTESVIRIGEFGITQAYSSGADARLRDVLRGAITDCAALLGPASVELRIPRAASLQFKEAIETRDRNDTIPKREGLLATRGR